MITESFIKFIKGWIKKETKEPSWFEIPKENFIGQEPLEGEFEEENSYFEIHIQKIFLKYVREYWINFRPMGVTYTRALYGGEVQEVPVIIDTGYLSKIEALKDEDDVPLINQRTAGVQVYKGDMVNLFAGVWGYPTKNYANEFMSLIESIGGLIDTTKIGTCLNLIKPIVGGLEKILGIKDLKFRVGVDIGFDSSSTKTPKRFRPGYWVILPIQQAKKEEFYIKDDDLFFGSNRKNLKKYKESDYMIFSIRYLSKREDIDSLPFYDYWEDTRDSIYDAAKNLTNPDFSSSRINFITFLKFLNSSQDLTSNQKLFLFQFFSDEYERHKSLATGQQKGMSPERIRSATVKSINKALNDSLKIANMSGYSKNAIKTLELSKINLGKDFNISVRRELLDAIAKKSEETEKLLNKKGIVLKENTLKEIINARALSI